MKKNNFLGINAGKASATLCLLVTTTFTQAQMNVAYPRDVSVSASTQAFDAKQTFKKVIGMLDLKHAKAGVSLYTTVIGTPGIPKVNVATLPKAEGSSVLEQNRNLSRFLQKGLADFEELDQPATHKRTEIFRSLVVLTDHFEPGANRTLLIIESDFISSGYVAEFFKYSNNPSGLMDDFEKIIEEFKKDNGGILPDLTGYEVVLVSSAGDNELALWSTRWWKRAMLHFGAKEVKVKAAL
ncbi:MAG: hypothetical protein ABJF04_16230 [Reichenbachiella sp.]|uniref:hypothetical protein n=1 Tax=Reichenbachiella sp. TaxID=2184521 RepID=UPI0032653BFF